MIAFLNRYFQFDSLGTNLRTEIIAGLSTYLSLAYIAIVNTSILAHSGMDVSAIMFATLIASGLATLAMGIWGRLPFAVAPGLEMSGFFAFTVCGPMGLNWQQGLGAVFWSGLLCILLTLLPVRQKIIDAIPDGLKTSIAVSVGVFVATIGLFFAKILAFKDGLPDFSALGFSQLATREAFVFYLGFAVCVLLNSRKFRFVGGMLAAIILAAIACFFLGIQPGAAPHLSGQMFSSLLQADFISILGDRRFLSVMLVFFIIDFYGGIGKFIGLTSATTIQSNGWVKNIEKALYVDGAGTVIGSALGTSSLIAFVESAVGIAAGGRTGLVAIVCGILLLLSFVFTPLVGLVPVEATAGVMLYVGYLLLPIGQLRNKTVSFGRFDAAVTLAMGALSLVTFSLDKAMLLGFLAYSLKQIFTRAEKVNPYMLATTAILVISALMQYSLK